MMRNSDGLPERIKTIMDGRSERNFCQDINIPLGSLRSALTGSKPSVDNLIILADGTGVSLDWLATGEGPMRSGGAVDDKILYIPRYDIEMSAGTGRWQDHAEKIDDIPFTAEFIQRRLGRSSTDGLIMAYAYGDSMEPTIFSGDLLMIDTNKKSVNSGIYAMAYMDMFYVKRLDLKLDKIEVISDSREKYKPFEIEAANIDQFNLVGPVIWTGRVLPLAG